MVGEGAPRTLALTGISLGTDRVSKGLVVLGVHTRSAKTRRALTRRSSTMDTTTLLIIVLVILLLGGGGWYGRGRWY